MGKLAKLSYIIFYVKEVPKSLSFYRDVFQIETRFVHESGLYAELDTGAVTLAFASDLLGKENFPKGYLPNDPKALPQAGEVAFTVENVLKSYEKALAAGGVSLAPPKEKPWGQTVAYVRDPNGILVEICSEMA